MRGLPLCEGKTVAVAEGSAAAPPSGPPPRPAVSSSPPQETARAISVRMGTKRTRNIGFIVGVDRT
jgi:hypothetical protein